MQDMGGSGERAPLDYPQARAAFLEGALHLKKQFDLGPGNNEAAAGYGRLIEMRMLALPEEVQAQLLADADLRALHEELVEKVIRLERLTDTHFARAMLSIAEERGKLEMIDLTGYPWLALIPAQIAADAQALAALHQAVGGADFSVTLCGFGAMPLYGLWLAETLGRRLRLYLPHAKERDLATRLIRALEAEDLLLVTAEMDQSRYLVLHNHLAAEPNLVTGLWGRKGMEGAILHQPVGLDRLFRPCFETPSDCENIPNPEREPGINAPYYQPLILWVTA